MRSATGEVAPFEEPIDDRLVGATWELEDNHFVGLAGLANKVPGQTDKLQKFSKEFACQTYL
eukprot:6256831-Lingulodinium_polyedra.AAC.1